MALEKCAKWHSKSEIWHTFRVPYTLFDGHLAHFSSAFWHSKSVPSGTRKVCMALYKCAKSHFLSAIWLTFGVPISHKVLLTPV